MIKFTLLTIKAIYLQTVFVKEIRDRGKLVGENVKKQFNSDPLTESGSKYSGQD